MSMFHPRPGETIDGEVDETISGPETTEKKDALLFDFDIDSEMPKANHLAYLKKVMAYMHRVLNLGSGRAFAVWLDGYASRTGDEQHNVFLSAMREQAIEAQLGIALDLDPDLKVLVDFKRNWHGFLESPPGEDPRYRSVRLVVTRPGPPPPPIRILPSGSTTWKIRLTMLVSAGVPVPGVPGLVLQNDAALFEIVDTSPGGKIGLFSYVGGLAHLKPGLAIGVPKMGPISGGGAGTWAPFSTSDRVTLRDFEGDASFGQPPAVWSYSLGPSMLSIQSHAFMMKECKTRPDPLPIDGLSVLVNIFASSMGTLKLRQVNGHNV